MSKRITNCPPVHNLRTSNCCPPVHNLRTSNCCPPVHNLRTSNCCPSGSTGKQGVKGETGPRGQPGPEGPVGPSGTPGTAAAISNILFSSVSYSFSVNSSMPTTLFSIPILTLNDQVVNISNDMVASGASSVKLTDNRINIYNEMGMDVTVAGTYIVNGGVQFDLVKDRINFDEPTDHLTARVVIAKNLVGTTYTEVASQSIYMRPNVRNGTIRVNALVPLLAADTIDLILVISNYVAVDPYDEVENILYSAFMTCLYKSA